MASKNYTNNYLYISEFEQSTISKKKILFAGAGIGSYIAEAALRIGFEKIHIIDGDIIEINNLNRQNYNTNDLGRYKAEVIVERLANINPEATITFDSEFLTPKNIPNLCCDYDIAINALDFSTKAPFFFDTYCQRLKIPIIHPYNLGWMAAAFVITDISIDFQSFFKKLIDNSYELTVAHYITDILCKQNIQTAWLKELIDNYKLNLHKSPPQLITGSLLSSSICTRLLFDIALGHPIKQFPDFYHISLI